MNRILGAIVAGCLVAGVVVTAVAGNVSAITGNRQDRIIQELVTGMNVIAGGLDETDLTPGIVLNATASTTDLKVRYGTCTNSQPSVTWGEVFTAVVYAEIMDSRAGTNNYFSAINTTNGTPSVAAGSGAVRWFVIGR